MSETPIPKKQLGELAERTSIDGKERFLTQGGLDADVGTTDMQFVRLYNVVKNSLAELSQYTAPSTRLLQDEMDKVRVLISNVAVGVNWQSPVTSVSNTPPATPQEGDRHIVGTEPAGDFLDHSGEIATFSTVWTFETPEETWGVFVQDTTQIYVFAFGVWELFGDLGRITDVLHEAEQARDSILNDPGFIAVSADLLGADNIGAVADSLATITAVKNNQTNITAVANNEENINAVNANKANINAVKANETNINAVALNKPNIDNVAVNKVNIDKVALNDSNVRVVAGDIANVNAVALNKANIDKVAETKVNIDAVVLNKPNIDAVAANKTNIDAVAGNEVNIDAVAGNNPNITAVAGNEVNINAVNANKPNIDAVATNGTNINAVSAIDDEVTTVAGIDAEVTALGARTTEIDALYAELGQIAVKENTANKKTTLVENSDTYFPTQKAVNLGLNRTMSEMMGFAPRNLMDVFGTLTVPATFEALRNYLTASGGCDFSLLRLGDYIDLDSFTVNNWYNGAAYDSTTGAWDTTVTVTKNLSYENTRVEIVGFSDYRYVGNTAYPSTPHVTFQFKNLPLVAPMHKLNASPFYSTSQGYTGSDLKTKGLANWYTAIASQFGNAPPRDVDRIIATSSDYEWCGAEKLFLPTGMNIFGSPGFARADRGVGTQHLFPLYALNPNSRMKKRNGSSRQYWWLAEPSAGSSSDFTAVYSNGTLYHYNSYYSIGVAPAFLI